MKRMGVGTSVSALLTVLLLVSGLFIVTLASQSVFSERVVELRKASEVASASAEVLQAFVYKDADTNRSLLTLRNSGAEGLEITDILAVSHEGNVVKSLKLPATLRLGPQQTATSYLSSIVGEEFDDYETVRNTIASFYFKTFRGRVFGSMYLAPASLDIAAYSTSTTATTATQTSTETLVIPSMTTTFTTRTITVIIDNPSHWPVETYVGVAFPRGYSMDGFPAWGFHPGLQARDQNNNIRNVALQDIRLPSRVACWVRSIGWRGGYEYRKWGEVGELVVRFAGTGPTYIATDVGRDTYDFGYGNMLSFLVCGNEQFIPHSTVRNIGTPTTVTVDVVETRECSSSSPPYQCTGTISIDRRAFIDTIRLWVTGRSDPNARRADFYGSVSNPWVGVSCSRYISRGNTTRTCTDAAGVNSYTDPVVITFSAGGNNINSISARAEVRYRYFYTTPIKSHNITFPSQMTFAVRHSTNLYMITDYYRLAYIKVVDLWNTTNILAFSEGNGVNVKIDRPVGLAAVYVYDRTVGHLPPPPSPPPPAKACINTINICESGDVGTQVRYESGGGSWQCADDPGGTQVVFSTTNPNACDAFVAPGAGTYSYQQIRQFECPKNGNTITCTASPGQTIIVDCDHRP
ncbi:MAG: hypothetical protein QXV27_08245 [Candidatus Caldarchaeum sp.]